MKVMKNSGVVVFPLAPYLLIYRFQREIDENNAYLLQVMAKRSICSKTATTNCRLQMVIKSTELDPMDATMRSENI